jgi:hypothetical protein
LCDELVTPNSLPRLGSVRRCASPSWIAPRRPARAAVAVATAAVTVVELATWRASKGPGSYGMPTQDALREALLVLGYPPTRRGRVHPVQRWRCQIAARSRDPRRSGVVVFTGGARTSDVTEAEVMATYARDALGLPKDEIRLEVDSLSTWEGVAFALPMLGDADVIKIASDPLHAARARSYLRRMRPDLAARLVPADDYRVLERWWIKAASLADASFRAIRGRLAGGTVFEVRSHPDEPIHRRKPRSCR